MLIICPGYLNDISLPLASDILYHKKLLYFLPTGFHPIELHSVAGFPSYCLQNSIALPSIIWEMCNLYFENGKVAIDCIDKIEPLRGKSITIAASSYARSRKMINESKKILNTHTELFELFKAVELDLRFAARELLSHVLFEIFLDVGLKGAIEYLQDNSRKPEDFLFLICAVLLNRLRIFDQPSIEIAVYEHSWYPLISKFSKINKSGIESEAVETSDEFTVEHFRYKLFETLLFPILGRCDSRQNSAIVAKLIEDKESAIDSFKEECKNIAVEIVLLPTEDENLRQDILKDRIKQRIVEPLSEILNKQRSEVKKITSDFFLDSTVVGGILTLLQGFNPMVISTAAAAGFISTGIRYTINSRSQKADHPSTLLAESILKSTIEFEKVQKQLEQVTLSEINIPDELKSKA